MRNRIELCNFVKISKRRLFVQNFSSWWMMHTHINLSLNKWYRLKLLHWKKKQFQRFPLRESIRGFPQKIRVEGRSRIGVKKQFKVSAKHPLSMFSKELSVRCAQVLLTLVTCIDCGGGEGKQHGGKGEGGRRCWEGKVIEVTKWK